MAIDAVSSAIAPAGLPATTAAPAPAGGGFTESLGRLLQATESAGQEANASVAGMLDGTRDVHDAMIALQQADLMLQLTVQVRNKIVQAYQDIMRMPV